MELDSQDVPQHTPPCQTAIAERCQSAAPSANDGTMPTETLDDEWIESLADAVAKRGLSAPVILLLELLKPLGFLGSQALLSIEPLLGTSLRSGSRRFARLLEDRRRVERLLDALERQRRSIGG